MKTRFLFQRHAGHLFLQLCIVLTLLCCMQQMAHASGSCTIVSAPSTFTLPTAVSVPRDAPVNTLIGSAVTQNYSFNCTTTNGFSPGGKVYVQFRTISGGTSYTGSGGGIILPTNLAGVGLLINSTPLALSAGSTTTGIGSDLITTAVSGATVTASISVQYIKTATTVTPGVVSAEQMFRFYWVILGYNNSTSFSPDVIVSLNGGTTVSVIACSVSAGSANLAVNLPTVTTSNFTGLASTTAKTGFALNLSCQAGTTVKITMATANPSGTYTGVVQPTTGTGYASGVGVQLLDGTNTPVSFGTQATVGASPNGSLAIPYSAQYFQTASSVTSGNVSATVTFTMSYQ